MIKTAAPKFWNMGVDDKSQKELKPEVKPYPSHMPKMYIFAEKGPTTAQVVNANDLIPLYGSETFNKKNKFYNENTKYLSLFAGEANNCVVQRVLPDENLVKANIRLYVWLGEMSTSVTGIQDFARYGANDPVPYSYKRNSDGERVTPSVNTRSKKYVLKHYTKTFSAHGSGNKPGIDFGEGVEITADLDNATDPLHDMIGKFTPIIDIEALVPGEYYNRIGIQLEPVIDDDYDVRIKTSNKIIPFKIQLVLKDSADAGTFENSTIKTLLSEDSIITTIKPNAVHPVDSSTIYVENYFQTAYFNETNPIKRLRYKIVNMHVYDDNIKSIFKKIHDREAEYLKAETDAAIRGSYDIKITDTTASDYETERYFFDIFSCNASSQAALYGTIIDESGDTLGFSTASDGTYVEALLKKITNYKAGSTGDTITNLMDLRNIKPVYLGKSSDGDISWDKFEAAIVKDMDRYLDDTDEYLSLALNPDTVIYDPGFTANTKDKLFNYITKRKDTRIVFSTHELSLGSKYKSPSEANGMATALKNRAKLAPESTYFGTKAFRAVIIRGSGLIDGDINRTALVYDFAKKSSAFMGAANGKWKIEKLFDIQPNNIISELSDVEPKFIADVNKDLFWSNEMIYPEVSDRGTYFYPALQTIYTDDTSVLNSYFLPCAVGDLTKAAFRTWTKFTGNIRYTEPVFLQKIKDDMLEQIENKFAGLFEIEVDTEITEADSLKGYIWRATYKIAANNMKTVMIFNTEAFRQGEIV